MAEAQKALERTGLTRGKAMLIGVLAVVLIGVLYLQYGSSDSGLGSEPVAYAPRRQPVQPANPAPTPAASRTPTPSAKETPADSSPELAAAVIVDETRWKSPELADVIVYDPFALPAAFPQPKVVAGSAASGADGLIAAAAADDAQQLADAVEQLRRQLEELKQSGVHIIVRERNQFVAMIGDRMVHVGDEIKGFTVTEIDPKGVRVERKVSP